MDKYEGRNYAHEAKEGISSPANNSIRLSRYIAALERYFGRNGFAFPVNVRKDGVDYKFDLYDVSEEMLIKVFTTIDEAAVDAFMELDDTYFIIDADHLAEPCTTCGKPCFEGIPQQILDVAEKLTAAIYIDDQFWTFSDGEWREHSPFWALGPDDVD